MKTIKTIVKNLKLLLRAKSSAFIVLFGPLLIILLVGLALNKPSAYELSVTYYNPDPDNSLTESFLADLENNQYILIRAESPKECSQSVQNGESHTCIVFPENFEMGKEGSNNLEFYVDYSRTNIVYQIIESVSGQIQQQTAEISKDLTQVLINKIDTTKKDIDKDILSIISIKADIDSIKSTVSSTKSKSESLDLNAPDISLSDISSSGDELYDDAKKLRDLGLEAVEAGGNTSGFDEIEDDIKNAYNDTPEIHEEFRDYVENVSDEIDNLEDQLSDAKEQNEEVSDSLTNIDTSLDSLKSTSDILKADLESSQSNLENINIANAENIVSPITTSIKPIVPESNQLVFFYPYLLVLVMMFIGIMLSSTLIIMEKKSKAFFRNFITPTRDQFFVMTTFITSFIVLFVQTIIILGISYYFIKTNLFGSIMVTILVLLITMSMFILIGMIIGYLSTTQEASTMLSIALGSIFLLLSNLVLPIETMSEAIKKFTEFNPYVVSSELLKQALLFEVELQDIWLQILFLASIMVVLFILVFAINKISKLNFLSRIPHSHKKGVIYVPEDAYLKIDKYIIKNKEDILTALQSMDSETFKKHVNKKNEIANWVSKVLQDKKLAWKLRTKNQKKMIKALDKHLKKLNKIKKKEREKIEKET